MRTRDWLEDLRGLSTEKVIVRHHPSTDRYLFSAAAGLPRVLSEGEAIGWRELNGESKECVELVIWTPPLNRGDCGLYVCGRLYFDAKSSPISATIFCFYDGTEKSPCYKTKDEAIHAMKRWALKHKSHYKEL